MNITNAVFIDEVGTAIRATVDGNATYITTGGELWDAAVKIAAPYSVPVVSNFSLLSRAYATRDMRTLQRMNYQRRGESTDIVDAKLAELDAQIDALKAEIAADEDDENA